MTSATERVARLGAERKRWLRTRREQGELRSISQGMNCTTNLPLLKPDRTAFPEIPYRFATGKVPRKIRQDHGN
ncbi:hypothetical protein [Novosphingobium pentaromativorans]|uniref:hypothetical protein n=1 Tax=Novosphingobium pentaromativorans TaxID=205844 RepID=UPI00193AC5DF|nr:hypothetical protein [Novosphingobium pentaromativorans]